VESTEKQLLMADRRALVRLSWESGMKWKFIVAAAVLVVGAVAIHLFGLGLTEGAKSEEEADLSRDEIVEGLRSMIGDLRPLHSELGPPEAGDWLSQHDEAGESFEDYLTADPVVPDEERRVIYLQPIGEFTAQQRAIVALTAEYVRLYFNLEVRVLPDKSLTSIPDSAQRRHPSWGMKQLLSTHLLYEVLAPALPSDAAALLGLTAVDLWPGEGWNFVFGQASLRKRVGVWSIYRNGDPGASDAEFALCLLRTIKTATHELGHMFSMQHCTKYECNMCGSNNREESDKGPLALCPECLAKVCWATVTDPVQRYRKLLTYCRKHGLKAEASFFEQSISALHSDGN
jgi:archaemetzincin